MNDSYETLLSDKLSRIKECGNCGWLFYDSSKNGKRRWCSMKTCGSNVKALQWYHRQKKQ
ncbi:MAG: CGNR zinc finger domain-containing protein [Segetibacter sp.]